MDNWPSNERLNGVSPHLKTSRTSSKPGATNPSVVIGGGVSKKLGMTTTAMAVAATRAAYFMSDMAVGPDGSDTAVD